MDLTSITAITVYWIENLQGDSLHSIWVSRHDTIECFNDGKQIRAVIRDVDDPSSKLELIIFNQDGKWLHKCDGHAESVMQPGEMDLLLGDSENLFVYRSRHEIMHIHCIMAK